MVKEMVMVLGGDLRGVTVMGRGRHIKHLETIYRYNFGALRGKY
jgi:hypothetical protein